MTTETQTEKASESVGIMIQVPKVLADAIERESGEKHVPKSRWVREFLAEGLGVELPVGTRSRVKKYATAEEREAAQKARAKTQRDVFQKLMQQYRETAGLGNDAGIEDFAKQLGLLDDDSEQ